MIIDYESMSLSIKTVLLILQMQHSLIRNEKTHLLWKFVRDLNDSSSDLKQNCVLHIILKSLRFSMISIKMVHIYCKYLKNAFKHGKNVQKYAAFMSNYAGRMSWRTRRLWAPTLGWDLFYRVILLTSF